MQMFTTDSEFVWKGTVRAGVPFLCDQDMELVAPANEYLRYVSTVKGDTRSPRTWITYGSHLYEFFAFIEANQFVWNAIDQTHIASWRDSMLGRGCARSTVNQRIRCIHSFYQWALRQKLLATIPFFQEDVRVRKAGRFFAHIDAQGTTSNANGLTLPTHSPTPKFLHIDSAIQFLESAKAKSLKLMGYVALLTGMRREEIVGLDRRVVPSPVGRDSGKQIPMVLDAAMTPTKGCKTRTVMLPYDLAVALWDYFCTEWPIRHKRYRAKHGKDSNRFFLSVYGEELSLQYLNNAFAKLSERSGIKCHPHMLRHTFGTYELIRMSEKYGQTKALLWVRDRMGHTSISTTELYVHSADLVKSEAIDGYQIEVIRRIGNADKAEKS